MGDGSFDWRSYLRKPKFIAAPVSCFKHVALSDCWESTLTGAYVEIRSPDCKTCCTTSPCRYWIASVIKVAGYFGLLQYEGYDRSGQKWVNLCDEPHIHPIGWCAENKKPLVPPKGIEEKQTDWKQFLVEKLLNQHTIPSVQFKNVEQTNNIIKIGMKLEVVDKNLISVVRSAKVTRVVGGRLHVVYSDIELEDEGFWCHERSPLIHPVGWAQIIGHALKGTPEYAKESLQKTLYRTFKPNDATWDMFLPVINPVRELKFKPGMKLEAIDPLNLSTICVATVTEVLRNNYLMIGIDGMMAANGSDCFCYHASSPCIFPVGFCDEHKIKLTPPRGYKGDFKWSEYLKKTKSQAAPVDLFHTDIPDHGYKEGMYLEAVDLMEPRLICVAYITKVVGRLLKVHFEGWEEDYDQWCDCESPDLFPVGWCDVLNYKLEPPRADPNAEEKKKKKPGKRKKRRGRSKKDSDDEDDEDDDEDQDDVDIDVGALSIREKPEARTTRRRADNVERDQNLNNSLPVNDQYERGQTNPVHESPAWTSEIDLLFNCIGYSVGLGNLWRFPYVAFKNGGGAFLFPYLILTLFISVPLYYMELFIGQNSKLNPVTVWSFCPAFKGLGISILLMALVIQVYYNVIMAYAFIYLLNTFQRVLPWSGCFKWWNADDNCYEVNKKVVLCDSLDNTTANATNCTNATESSADQFFKVHVLGLSSGLDDPGTVKWDLALALLATWTIVCLLVIGRYHTKVQVMCKTIYITALLPFVLLSIYFCYTITLSGAVRGLNKLFIPNWSSLNDIKVWSEAAQTSMFSVGVGTGGLIIFGGKAGYRYSTAKCTFVSCAMDTLAAVLAATVTFMVVGFMAELFDLKFSETTLSGHGLVFVTFPNAVLKMDAPHVWSFAFFSLLFCLALDTSIAQTETISSGIHFLFCSPAVPMKPLVALASGFLFLCGLSCVTNGGSFVLNILDNYGGGHSLMGTVMLESVAFGWGYGMYQASEDIEKMQGSSPNFFMKLCWTVLAPLSLILMFLYSLIDSELASLYNIPYPWYTGIIGWSIVAIILLPVPVWMVIVLFQHRKDVLQAFKPNKVWKNAVQKRRK